MKDFTKEMILFGLFGILCLMLGAVVMNIYHIKHENDMQEKYLLMAEDIIHKQNCEYKQLWIEKQRELPIIEYTYVEEVMDENISN